MKSVGDLLREFLKEKGWLGGNPYEQLVRPMAEDRRRGRWPAHARLVDVRNNILIVEVDHPGWLQMLRLRQEAILEAARSAAPMVPIEGIRVRVGGRDTADH